MATRIDLEDAMEDKPGAMATSHAAQEEPRSSRARSPSEEDAMDLPPPFSRGRYWSQGGACPCRPAAPAPTGSPTGPAAPAALPSSGRGSTSSDGATASSAGPHLTDVTGRLAALPPPAAGLLRVASAPLVAVAPLARAPPLPLLLRRLKLLLVPLLVSAALAEVLLSPATFSCITRMPMKGEILVGTMEKTLKPGVFLKLALIETIFLPS